MVGPTGQLWWLALRAHYNGWPSCFDGGSHRAVVMVGLACPLQWIAQLMMWWWAPPGRCDGWPCVSFYNEWPTIVLVWGPLAHQMIVLVWLAHRPQCWWPYMSIGTADPACPLRWWILAPNHGHHLRPSTLMVVHYVMCDGWPVWSPMMVGPSGPLWLAPHAHYSGWLCGPVMAAGINDPSVVFDLPGWLLLMMVGPYIVWLVKNLNMTLRSLKVAYIVVIIKNIFSWA